MFAAILKRHSNYSKFSLNRSLRADFLQKYVDFSIFSFPFFSILFQR